MSKEQRELERERERKRCRKVEKNLIKSNPHKHTHTDTDRQTHTQSLSLSHSHTRIFLQYYSVGESWRNSGHPVFPQKRWWFGPSRGGREDEDKDGDAEEGRWDGKAFSHWALPQPAFLLRERTLVLGAFTPVSFLNRSLSPLLCFLPFIDPSLRAGPRPSLWTEILKAFCGMVPAFSFIYTEDAMVLFLILK